MLPTGEHSKNTKLHKNYFTMMMLEVIIFGTHMQEYNPPPLCQNMTIRMIITISLSHQGIGTNFMDAKRDRWGHLMHDDILPTKPSVRRHLYNGGGNHALIVITALNQNVLNMCSPNSPQKMTTTVHSMQNSPTKLTATEVDPGRSDQKTVLHLC